MFHNFWGVLLLPENKTLRDSPRPLQSFETIKKSVIFRYSSLGDIFWLTSDHLEHLNGNTDEHPGWIGLDRSQGLSIQKIQNP